MKPILITGMPRSGTTFLSQGYFEAGEERYTDDPDATRCPRFLNEPPEFSHKFITVQSVEKWVNSFPQKNFVVKHHNLRNLGSFEMFDRVIVCVRESESWIKSASEYADTSGQAAVRGLSLYEYWSECHEESMVALDIAGDKGVRFDYNNPEFDWAESGVKAWYERNWSPTR